MSPRALGITALVLAAVVSVGIGGQSLTRVWQIKSEVETLERQIAGLRAENAQLQAEVAELRSDPDAIERIAREKLGLIKPGDRVYKLPPTPGGQ